MTTVKAKLGDELRRFNIEDGIYFVDFVSILEKIYPQKETLTRLFDIKYMDEENDYIPITTSEELKEAIRIAKGLQPPILRVTLNPKSSSDSGIETTVQITNSSKPTSEPISNWGKKLIEEEKNSLSEEHVVKICGKPWIPENEHSSQSSVSNQQGNKEVKESKDSKVKESGESKVKESVHVNVNIDSKVKESGQPKKKTIKETVEEYSEGLNFRSQQWSEDIALKTKQYSENILDETTPIAQNISNLTLNTAEMLNNKIYQPQVNIPDVKTNDDLVLQVSSKVDEKFKETTKNINEYSMNVNQQTSIYSTLSSICNDLSDGALKLVDEKTIQVMIEVENARKKYANNSEFNIYMKANINEAMIIDIENKVDNMSSNTSDKMSDISENIAKNIMSI